MEYQTKCFKIRLKPNSIERVREWAKTLNNTRREEALATLREETVVFEGVFLDTNAEGVSSLDWSQCPAVESVLGRLGGAWVFGCDDLHSDYVAA